MENPPCKLIFQQYDITITIERAGSDISIDDFRDMCKGIAYAALFRAESVSEYFDND